jgi:2-polyprenyl-3-methyl-5-hydroxy-6-metoxy-1,4-benzoquinol methylase
MTSVRPRGARSRFGASDRAARGLFVVGNARSGTSILCDCLNTSADVHLLHEAHVFLNHRRRDFVSFFNEQHARFGNHRSKGTYLPPGPRRRSAMQVWSALARKHRWIGEKIAFGPHPVDPPPQEAFFGFHTRHFPDAWYALIVRRPSETVWSMSKMFPAVAVEDLIVCWLRTAAVTIEVARTFPRTAVLFWDRLDGRALQRLARRLDVRLAVPPGMFDRGHAKSRIEASTLPALLMPFERSLARIEALYSDLRAGFSPVTFGLTTVDPRAACDDLLARIQLLDRAVRNGRLARARVAFDSGERLVPESASLAELGEHRSRYALAAPLVAGRRVVDLGCGAGYGSAALAQAGAALVVGLDASAEAIAYARSHHAAENVRFDVCDLAALDLPQGAFDVAVMFEVIEHVEAQHDVLRRAARLLTDDGVLMLSTPNAEEHPRETFNPYHTHELSRGELRALARPHFRHVDVYGFGMGFGAILHERSRPRTAQVSIDWSTFETSAEPAAPFLVAVCGRNSPPPRLRATFLPCSYDRIANSAAWRDQQHTWARQLANDLVLQYAADVTSFRRRLPGLDDIGRTGLEAAVRNCIDHGQHGLVVDLVRILGEERPHDATWPFLLGVCLVRIDRARWHDEARRCFDRALALGYDEFWTRLHRGALHLAAGRVNAALADLHWAHAAAPLHDWARDAYAEAIRAAGAAPARQVAHG